MIIPEPRLNGNTYLSNGMVVRFSPDGVAVPVSFDGSCDVGSLAVVRDYLSENGVSNAANFHDGLEWRVLHFVARAHFRSLSLSELLSNGLARYQRYSTARGELLSGGFRLPLPVELVSALSSSGESLNGLRNFVLKYDSDISVSAAILTGLSVSSDGFSVNEGGRFFVYERSVFEGSVNGEFPLVSDFRELLYGRRFVDGQTAEVHPQENQELFAHYIGDSFIFRPQSSGSASNYNAFSVLVRPLREGNKPFSVQRF